MAKKILVIDDDPEFVGAVSNLLESKGYAVVSASNGKEGFKKAKSMPFDLILLDVMMTHKSEGFDVARSMKADAATKNIPVVLITGIRKDMNLPFGFEADEDWLPVKTVLEKPVKPDMLLKVVEEYIGK
jgi:CheY-like chemotaxis protein